MEQELEEKYRIGEPAAWATPLTEEELLSNIVESDFSQQQYDEGKDYCYFLRKIQYTDDTQNAEYNCMAYSVQQPGTLEFAAVNEFVLYPSEQMIFHRIAIVRDGVLIDKLPDTKFKVLDNEGQSLDGVINSSKKVNISIKDVRLYDIILVEDTRVLTYTDKDFLRKELTKYVWSSPDVYWAYGSYAFDFINKRSKPVAYKKQFFRDEQGDLLPVEEGLVGSGNTFSLRYEHYLNPVDVNRELFPFIDFATQYTYEELLDLVVPYYEAALTAKPLPEYAPDLVAKLDALGDDIEAKIQLAVEFVQNHVRYIYNEEEMHGHKPQDPWVTYEFKQGDCKAKTVLLKCVLDYLGVDSSVALVNYNADYYLKYYLPSLFNFNHVIVKVRHKEKAYFVDATYRDEYGTLENRTFISFLNYMEIKRNGVLQQREPFKSSDFSIFDEITLDVKDEVGTITIKTTYRYGRANGMRRYVKTTNKKAVIDNTNNFVFSCMDFVESENGNDKRQVFKDASLTVVNDDKVGNVFVTLYTARIDKPYFLGNDGRKYLKFYDGNVLKNHLKDYVLKDVSFWHSYDSERYSITIRSDKPIDTQDHYTNRQMDVDYEFFKYTVKKEVDKYSATAKIEYIPLSNVEVPVEDIPSLRDKYAAIGKESAFGLGVAIAKPGFFDTIKALFGGK
ncbi:hypothetical protein [Sphingobacterium gobiense]|uniref:DUF3857 domain-containing protein n=1 Tax=Sphingobacterium gobiense TaxID=1382456 RepID=A0A2S9JHY6_9SPHI|nr:hypothetical protein [Sphingobacterium gobiense]PRD52612.1 hypothetical protein C5749_15390 [Sphingobacterium gobiense]